jgi:hypothetical protein
MDFARTFAHFWKRRSMRTPVQLCYVITSGFWRALRSRFSLAPTAKSLRFCAAILVQLVVLSAGALAQQFSSIDVPNAVLTAATGINTRGQIVGGYLAAGGGHGFLLDRGVFTTIDVPGAIDTAVWGINDQGQMVGECGYERKITWLLLVCG